MNLDELVIENGKFGKRMISPGRLASDFEELTDEEVQELVKALIDLFNRSAAYFSSENFTKEEMEVIDKNFWDLG